MEAREKREDVLRRLARHLGRLVPQLEERVDVVVDGEDHPEPVAFHQLGQRRGLPLIVRETFQEAVFVNLSDEERWSQGHGTEEGRKVLVGSPLVHQAPESEGQDCEIVQLQQEKQLTGSLLAVVQGPVGVQGAVGGRH